MMTLAPPRPAPPTVPGPPPRAEIGTRTSGFYRHDLDGLRGVAIALVAVFHVWFGRVSGGVDVFLALSGFFFGGRLLRTALTPGASLWPVPEVRRLVRRLLPALVVVLAVSALLTILIQPETRWETFADQSLASLGYFQNWELANTASDYLRAGEAVSPLQHIWSMSVQGQFYIAFLALIFLSAWLFRRVFRKHMRAAFVVLLSALTIASFVYAIFAHNADQATAYYNSFARAWELLLGALIGALVPYVRWPMWLRTTVAVVSLAAILACGALIDGVKEFPGPWALVPVGATILFILSAANRLADPHTGGKLPAPNRLLATAPFVSLGAMAYSLYLWHWPLLIFWLSHTGHTQASFADGAAVLAVSGVLAWLTTKYVENPLRYRAPANPLPVVPLRTRLRRPTMVLGSVVALLGVALTATSFTWREHVTVERANGKELSGLSSFDYPGAHALLNHAKVPKLPMRPTVLEAKRDIPKSTSDGCISDFNDTSVINCTYGDESATRTIALAGGSHAEHWVTALDMLGRLHNFKVVTYLKMGCPLTTEKMPLVMGDNRPYPKCRAMERAGDDQAHRRPPGLRVHHLHPAVEHQTGRRDAGHLHRYLAEVVGQQYSDSRYARHPMAGAQWQTLLPRRLPGRRRQCDLLRDQAIRRTVAIQPHIGFRRAVPTVEAARHERCGVPKGLLSRRGGKCVAVSRLSPHLDHVHAHHGRRARTSDRRRHRLVG